MVPPSGISAAIRGAVPASLEVARVLVTTPGGATPLTFGLAVLGRRSSPGDRFRGWRRLPRAPLIVALKSWIGAPRPPEAVAMIAGDGFGFPSGHATAAVVVDGGLAIEFDRLDDLRVLVPVVLPVVAEGVAVGFPGFPAPSQFVLVVGVLLLPAGLTRSRLLDRLPSRR